MARSNVQVRRADPGDVVAIAHLVRAVGTRTGVFSGRPLLDPSVARLSGRLGEIINDGERELLVAVDDGSPAADGTDDGSDGRIVGMLAAMRDDIGAIDFTRVLHVTHLMVDPGFRRRGVGRALLSGAVEMAERDGLGHLIATTASDSRESNRYLARVGFTPLVVQRIAATGLLRRTLGMAEPMPGGAVLRRARLIRAQRARLASYSGARST